MFHQGWPGLHWQGFHRSAGPRRVPVALPVDPGESDGMSATPGRAEQTALRADQARARVLQYDIYNISRRILYHHKPRQFLIDARTQISETRTGRSLKRAIYYLKSVR